MITTGSKWFFGLAFVSFVLGAAYGWGTGGDRLGPVTAGYWGGVGDHLGYTILMSISLAASFLGLIAVITRDSAPSALAELAGTDQAPPAVAPSHAAYWPVVGAFGATLVVLGLVISNVLFIVGLLVLAGVLVEWMVLAWSDRATGDPELNHQLRTRLMAPFEVPIAGFLIVAGSVVAISRVLLTSSQMGAVAVATVLGMLILAIGAVIATRPRLSPNLVAGVLALSAVGIVAVGVVSAARGERFIERHSEEHGEEHPEEEDSGIKPNIPAGTDPNTTTTESTGGEG